MDEESITLLFGVIFLILMINTTILWSIASSIYGQSPAQPIMLTGNVPDPISSGLSNPVPSPVPSPVPNSQPIMNQGAALSDSPLSISNPDLSASVIQIPDPVPGSQPIMNQGAALSDSPLSISNPDLSASVIQGQPAGNSGGVIPGSQLIKTNSSTSASTKSIASYISIEMPETPEMEFHPNLQPKIPQRDFDGFVTVYSLTNQDLSQALPRISMNLVNPPLVIDFSISPLNVRDVKYIEHKEIATLYKENVIVNRTYEDSWFQVIVRNKDTGAIIEEDGFGRTYSFENKRQMVVRTGGNYCVEFDGAYATVDLTIRVRDTEITS